MSLTPWLMVCTLKIYENMVYRNFCVHWAIRRIRCYSSSAVLVALWQNEDKPHDALQYPLQTLFVLHILIFLIRLIIQRKVTRKTTLHFEIKWYLIALSAFRCQILPINSIALPMVNKHGGFWGIFWSKCKLHHGHRILKVGYNSTYSPSS